MGFIEEGQQFSQHSEDSEIAAIEKRIGAAERKVIEILKKRTTVRNAPGNTIDTIHAEIMTVLTRLENSLRSDVLERLARLESKLQNVA